MRQQQSPQLILLPFLPGSAVNLKCNVTIFSGADYTGTKITYGSYFKGTRGQVATVTKLPQVGGWYNYGSGYTYVAIAHEQVKCRSLFA